MAAEKEAQHRFTLGNRIFRVVNDGTVERDIWVVGHCRKAGLHDLHRSNSEAPDDFVDRILGQLAVSGSAMSLLGGLVVPEHLEDSDWSPAVAEDTARFIGRLSDPTDKATVRILLASLVLDFFASGMASRASSTTSSRAAGASDSHPGATPSTI